MSWLKKVVEAPLWAFVVGLAVIAGTIFVGAEYFDRSSDVGNTDGSSESTGSGVSNSPPETDSSSPRNSSDSLSVGDCLASHQDVPCDTSHDSQVYGEGGVCDTQHLLDFLGGVPEIDVLIPSVTSSQVHIDSRIFCVLSPPPSDSSRSADRVLLSSGSDAWRLCLDDRDQQMVACSVPHTTEIVYQGVPANGEPLDCAARATTYTNTTISRLEESFVVESASTPSGAYQCRVRIRTANLLTASLRRIGSNAFPIAEN